MVRRIVWRSTPSAKAPLLCLLFSTSTSCQFLASSPLPHWSGLLSLSLFSLYNGLHHTRHRNEDWLLGTPFPWAHLGAHNILFSHPMPLESPYLSTRLSYSRFSYSSQVHISTNEEEDMVSARYPGLPRVIQGIVRGARGEL
jgi:hypothetical protein